MKKLFFAAMFALGLFIGNIAFAQTANLATGSSTTGTSTPSIALDYRYNALLEFFLQQIGEGKFKDAYENNTAGNFPKIYTLDDFTNIVTAAGLTDYTSKKWTSFQDQIKEIGVTTIAGEFTSPKNIVHLVAFQIIIGGETELKIGGIIENISFSDLPKRFPAGEQLDALIREDLGSLTNFISKNKSKKIYALLSINGKKRAKLTEIQKAIRTIKGKRLNVQLPLNSTITLLQGDPKLNEQGLMVARGTYANAKFKVDFTLAYDYEWKWKLGGFSLTATAVKK